MAFPEHGGLKEPRRRVSEWRMGRGLGRQVGGQGREARGGKRVGSLPGSYP